MARSSFACADVGGRPARNRAMPSAAVEAAAGKGYGGLVAQYGNNVDDGLLAAGNVHA